MLDEGARMRELDAGDLLRGGDVRGVFFVCPVNIGSGRGSFMLAVELYKPLKFSSWCDEVLFLPKVVEWV